MPTRIYLDHAATTPMLPEARAAVADAMARWANPSSPHAEGRAARAALEDARCRIKAALGWEGELIFTSGATEAAAIALTRQARPRPVLVGATEHAAVLGQRHDAVLPVDRDGIVQVGDLPAGALVAVQHANSETGVIQPIAAIAAAVRGAGGVLLVDCAQTAGRLPLPEADVLIVSAHKLGGPPGIGALLVRDPALIAANGGGQEQGYRAGTENVPAAVGFAAAAEAPGWIEAQHGWRAALEEAIRAAGGVVIGAEAPRTPTIGAYRLPGLAAATQLIRLDMAGFAVSAGSACSSGSMRPSQVLTAMGLDESAAGEVIRVSFGRTTTEAEVMRFAEAWVAMAASVRRRAA